MNGYKTRWENNNQSQTISFRFLERITNNNLASERGIYKLSIDVGTPSERSFYGKFHVLHKKENGSWKIMLDYDSSEKATINQESYQSAFAIDAFEKF